MASVHDVASYMLRQRSMTAMKLQKLAYYAQAWHLVDTREALFAEPIEAWANGPVVRDLYDVHRGQFSLSTWPRGDGAILSESERRTIDTVLQTYGTKDAQWLSEQTHRETPWQEARAGVPTGVRSTAVIAPELIERYYSDARARGDGPDRVIIRS